MSGLFETKVYTKTTQKCLRRQGSNQSCVCTAHGGGWNLHVPLFRICVQRYAETPELRRQHICSFYKMSFVVLLCISHIIFSMLLLPVCVLYTCWHISLDFDHLAGAIPPNAKKAGRGRRSSVRILLKQCCFFTSNINAHQFILHFVLLVLHFILRVVTSISS